MSHVAPVCRNVCGVTSSDKAASLTALLTTAAPLRRGSNIALQFEGAVEEHEANQSIMKYPHISVLLFIRQSGKPDFVYNGVFRYVRIAADNEGKWFDLLRADVVLPPVIGEIRPPTESALLHWVALCLRSRCD